MGISDNRGYQVLAGRHGAPDWYCWHHQQNARIGAEHAALPALAPRLSLQLGDGDARPGAGSDAALVGLDTRPPRQSGLPGIFTDRTGADGQPNPLLGFRINLPQARPPVVRTTSAVARTRRTGCRRRTTSTTAFRAPTGSDFSAALEDMHDQVHGWVSGDMGVIGDRRVRPDLLVASRDDRPHLVDLAGTQRQRQHPMLTWSTQVLPPFNRAGARRAQRARPWL